MRELTLVRKNLLRRKGRALLSLLAISIAFLIFGLASAFHAGALSQPSTAGATRLIVSNKISFTQPLPVADLGQIASIAGVRAVTHRTWFSGYYREPRNFIVTYAVDPDSYFEVNPESGVAPAAVARFRARRDAALVGTAIAQKYGFKLGDHIALFSSVYGRRSGGQSWDFEVVGLIPPVQQQAQNTILMNYAYLDAARTYGNGGVSQFLVRLADARGADAVIRAIDSRFANSLAETSTMTESAYNQAFSLQFANVSLIVLLVTSAAFVSILMIVGSAMAAAARERKRETGVLVSLGFSQSRIARQVLSETLSMASLGAFAGMGAAALLLSALRGAAKGQFDNFILTPQTWGVAGLLTVAFAVSIAIAPLLLAFRLDVPGALRRV